MHITAGEKLYTLVTSRPAPGDGSASLPMRSSILWRFLTRPPIVYIVDTFGHPATLPDILEAAGCVGYVFHRPTPLQVDLPANVFRWRGPGGGEVMGMRLVPAYVTFGADLSEQILGAAQAVTPGVEHVMWFYCVGQHWGGP